MGSEQCLWEPSYRGPGGEEDRLSERFMASFYPSLRNKVEKIIKVKKKREYELDHGLPGRHSSP